jgi:hypothetical protein
MGFDFLYSTRFEFPLWSRPHIQSEVVGSDLTPLPTFVPLLYLWAHLAWQADIIGYRIYNWISPLMPFLPQQPVEHLLAL